jgi:hypothetical protein
MYRSELPGGVHYGTKLKVFKGQCIKTLGKCAYFNNTYFAVDINYISLNEFVINKNYFIFLTFFNHQWWIFDYICI